MQNLWSPPTRKGWIIGLACVAVLLAATVALVVVIVTLPISIRVFLLSLAVILLLGLAFRLLYQLWGLTNASYEMDRNSLLIRWGGVQHQIPMASISGIMSGAELVGHRYRPGIRWPGYSVGVARTQDIDTVLHYATLPRSSQIIIKTAGVAYAISPSDLEGFLVALRERLEMGPTLEVNELSTHPSFLDWSIWRDRWGLGILLASIALLTLLVGVICWRYPYLQDEIAMRFTPQGEPLLLAQKVHMFYLTVVGAIFIAINGAAGLIFYRRERTAALFLWSGMLAAVASLWAAVISVLVRH